MMNAIDVLFSDYAIFLYEITGIVIVILFTWKLSKRKKKMITDEIEIAEQNQEEQLLSSLKNDRRK